jgi:hypothetical protein
MKKTAKRVQPTRLRPELSDIFIDCYSGGEDDSDDDADRQYQLPRRPVARRRAALNLTEAATPAYRVPLARAAAAIYVDVHYSLQVPACTFVIAIQPHARQQLLQKLSLLREWNCAVPLHVRRPAAAEYLRAALFCIVHGAVLPAIDEEHRRVEKELLAKDPDWVPDVRRLIDKRDPDWSDYNFVLPDEVPSITVLLRGSAATDRRPRCL